MAELLEVLAEGDFYGSTGTDKARRITDNSLVARVDNFAGSLIPIDDLETLALYLVENTIEVHSGALLESYGVALVGGEAEAEE